MILLKRYNVSDDFLFGCVLAEGEYLTPTQIPKNEIRRARDIWQPVVAQYARPSQHSLKQQRSLFPFWRFEMNLAANTQEAEVMRILYHSAQLPRSRFPVGFDMVDKNAKSDRLVVESVSARMAARVLNRTIAEGDAQLVTPVRKLLAHTPRDFCYRPRRHRANIGGRMHGRHIGTVIGNTSPHEFSLVVRSRAAKIGVLVAVGMEVPTGQTDKLLRVTAWGRIIELDRYNPFLPAKAVNS